MSHDSNLLLDDLGVDRR